MTNANRVKNTALLSAGLEAMRRSGKPLTRRPSKGRARIYAMPNGETVRARTSNDHILIIIADKPSLDARLNIQGTDWLLIVMPEEERTPGKVRTYLIPSEEVAREARRSHEAWLASEPNTHGGNVTWNLWFNDRGPKVASGYDETWSKYLLDVEISTEDVESEATGDTASASIHTVVEAARSNIASVAGVPPSAVKISIDFGA